MQSVIAPRFIDEIPGLKDVKRDVFKVFSFRHMRYLTLNRSVLESVDGITIADGFREAINFIYSNFNLIFVSKDRSKRTRMKEL